MPKSWLTQGVKGPWIVHSGVWVLLLLFPWIAGVGDFSVRHIIGALNTTVFLAIIFYINHLWLVARGFHRTHLPLFLAINIGMFLALSGFGYLLHDWLLPSMDSRPRVPIPKTMTRHAITYVAAILTAIALDSIDRLRLEKLNREKAERLHAEAKMVSLSLQIQPHFLFNSLNNIYALISIQPALAMEALMKLSGLLRFLLASSKEKKVSLKEEFDFLKDYVDLMRLRTNDNVSVTLDLPKVDEQQKVPPLLFVSLVENAFKHGVHATKTSNINISARLEENRLRFSVKNLVYKSGQDDRSGSGIGIENLRERLQMTYGEGFSLSIEQKDDVHIAELIIQINDHA